MTDPNFGSRILRVTDKKSDPGRRDGSLNTPSSAEQNSWNKTSTKFYVLAPGGQKVLYDFDPTSMKVRQADVVDMLGEPEFSYTRADILYGLSRTGFQEYDTAKRRFTEVNDFSKCLRLEGSDKASVVSVSGDDKRLMTALGPQQDKYYIVYIYDRALGCRWYNTQTGEIGGKWGPTGVVALPDRFTLHNARMSKSGKFISMTRGGGGGLVVWDVDTLNPKVCTLACGGHHVLGYSHALGGSGRVHPLDLWLRSLEDLNNYSALVPNLQHVPLPWYDFHFSWNNVDATDSAPACFSTYVPVNPDTPGVPLYVAEPWENEIDCVETDGAQSRVWRFAHTYSTARNGFWSSPRGNVSQDGRFFMFTSDWQDQLGRAQDGKYRNDVFIVELR